MATTYTVLWEYTPGNDGQGATSYFVVSENVEANNAEHARRIVATNGLDPQPQAELEDKGVFLVAVPARNWNVGRGMMRAETTRRIRSA